MLVTEITVLCDQVHLRQHVDVWELEVQHYPERGHEYCDVLRSIRNVVGVAKVHSGQLGERCVSDWRCKEGEPYPKATFRELSDDPLQALVIRAEFDLTGEIEDNVCVLSQRFEFLIQPVEVLVEVLHAV